MDEEETLTFPIRLCFCYTFLFLLSSHRLRALDLNTLSRLAIANPLRFGGTDADVHVFLLFFFFFPIHILAFLLLVLVLIWTMCRYR